MSVFEKYANKANVPNATAVVTIVPPPPKGIFKRFRNVNTSEWRAPEMKVSSTTSKRRRFYKAKHPEIKTWDQLVIHSYIPGRRHGTIIWVGWIITLPIKCRISLGLYIFPMRLVTELLRVIIIQGRQWGWGGGVPVDIDTDNKKRG